MVYDDKKFSTVGAANTIFQWEDVIASVGYKTFYAMKTSGGSLLITSTNPSNSRDWATSNNVTGSTELNFDHEFLTGSDIEGEGYCSLTIDNRAVGAGLTAQAVIRLLHVDTSNTETLIATATTDQMAGTAATTSERLVVDLTIPDTHFSEGEKMRLEIVTSYTITPGATIHIYHDPANRGTVSDDRYTFAAGRSDLQLKIPFRLPV